MSRTVNVVGHGIIVDSVLESKVDDQEMSVIEFSPPLQYVDILCVYFDVLGEQLFTVCVIYHLQATGLNMLCRHNMMDVMEMAIIRDTNGSVIWMATEFEHGVLENSQISTLMRARRK